MKSLHSDPMPEHTEYPCRADCIQVARLCLDKYELRGGRKLLDAAIDALKQAKALETGKGDAVHMRIRTKNGERRIFFRSET